MTRNGQLDIKELRDGYNLRGRKMIRLEISKWNFTLLEMTVEEDIYTTFLKIQ